MIQLEDYPVFTTHKDLKKFIVDQDSNDYTLLELYNEFSEVYKLLSYPVKIKKEFINTVTPIDSVSSGNKKVIGLKDKILVRLATTSIGKIHEIESYLRYNIVGKLLNTVFDIKPFLKGEYEDVDESDHSCEINSKLKSTIISRNLENCFVLAEDSAFSLNDINSYPGVISHRFHKIYLDYVKEMYNFNNHKNVDKFYDIVLDLDNIYSEFKFSVANIKCSTDVDIERLNNINNSLLKADSINNIHVILLYKELLEHEIIELNHRYLAHFKTTSSIAYNGAQIASGTGYLVGELFMDYDFNNLDSLEKFINGYGYNPIFVPNDSSLTLSEHPIQSVVQWNHRSKSLTKALKALLLEVLDFDLRF